MPTSIADLTVEVAQHKAQAAEVVALEIKSMKESRKRMPCDKMKTSMCHLLPVTAVAKKGTSLQTAGIRMPGAMPAIRLAV